MAVKFMASRRRQRGSSVIELPVITLILVLLIVFAVKLGHGLSLKTELDRLAYSLTSVVTSDRLEIPLSGSGDVITPQLADALLVIAERQFQFRTRQSSVGVGIHLEQLKFDDTGAVLTYQSESAGDPCTSRQGLRQLARLWPTATLPGTTSERRPDLFQVSVCLTSLPSLSGKHFSILTQDFTERYFNSAALLIGRQYD